METVKNIFTLKNKLVFLFLMLALVPLAVIGYYSIKTTESLIENLVLRQLDNIATDNAIILERWLEKRKQDMMVIAGTSIVKSMNPVMMAPYLELIRTQYAVYNNLSVYSEKGELVFSTGEAVHTLDPSLVLPDKKDSLVFTPVTYLPDERESTFQIIAPVFRGDNQIGSVLSTVGTHNIINIILQVALGETGECYLVDRNGTFLAHKEPRRILSENISQSEGFKNIFDNRDRKKTYLDYRNIEVLGTSCRVGGTDWYIIVEQDRDEAFRSADSMKRLIGFMVFLAIASALGLTWVISYHVIRPVRNLSRWANNLALSNFTHEGIETNRKDEIGTLCRAFFEMARMIQHRQNTLEKKFNLKAAELEETGQTLKHVRIIAERSEKFAALGRLGAAISHEIRTPLTSLKLFLESIHSEIEISPEFIEDFGIAMGQISRIEVAINRLLDYTKPKDMVFSKISVAYLIRDVVALVRPLANKQECVLEAMVSESLPEITGDIKLLEEALINLFINSLEAMSEKGHISVKAELTTGKKEEKGYPIPMIRIDIEDTGAGIAPKDFNDLFEPFFTTKSAGTGLGLPMVSNTLKRHNGEILAGNRKEGGAIFSIFLPVSFDEKHANRKNITD